jgi:transposase
MPRRLTLVPHCSAEELHHYYRRAKDPIARSHFQMLWLLAQGQSTREVAQATGYSCPWIRQLVRRYNARGPQGLEDRRHDNPGQRPRLAPAQVQALAAALERPTDDGGLWSGPKVARWMSGVLGGAVKPQVGWVWLRRLGYSVHAPRPCQVQADPTARAHFKKASRRRSLPYKPSSRRTG